MNEHEARLLFHGEITEILVDLAADEDDLTEADETDLREAMSDVAEMVLDALGLEIAEIHGETVTATLQLPA